MEIKKGISQMAEYPNIEINYVVPEDGQMYYVLRNGELANGAVIATLDPKRAIDEGVSCNNIGVFNEDGSVLIDFDKKEIKKINDELLLVVNSVPTTETVVNALKNENDEISKTMMKDHATTIVDKMMIEMGITGEVLFSDAYSEANVYRVDSYNNKIGPDSSFIGKNDSSIYFHDNDATTETKIISLTGEQEQPALEPSETPEVKPEEENSIELPETPIEPEVSVEPELNEIGLPTADMDFNPVDIPDLKLDISQNILDGFKPMGDEEEQSEETNEVTEEPVSESDSASEPEEEKVETPQVSDEPEENTDDSNDMVLDNVISVMKKMIEETNKLTERIADLQKEINSKTEELESKSNELDSKLAEIEEKDKVIEEKTKIIEDQESKKTELNSLLNEANEVLENIEE